MTVSAITRAFVDATTLQPVPRPSGVPADATETELRQASAAVAGVLLVHAHEAVGV